MFEDPNDDEKFRQMLGGIIGQGPAPYDVQTSMEQPPQPEQSQLSAPYMPQGAAPGGIGGYTPPPAAGDPAYLDHVQGHQFGGGDVAMLGGILAALLGGGKHRGEIAGSLAGQYGGAVMQNNARADDRNQKIDQYNNTLENKSNDPLDRWKAEQTAKYQVGSLKTRGDELGLQQTREGRIAAQQAAEDAKDPVEQARLIEEARGNARLATKRQENDMEVGTREMLGQILGKQKKAAGDGKGGGDLKLGEDGKPIPGNFNQYMQLHKGDTKTPKQELDDAEAAAKLVGIKSGKFDAATGKEIDDPNAVDAKQVREFNKDTSYARAMAQQLDSLDAVVGKYKEGTLPGVGKWEGGSIMSAVRAGQAEYGTEDSNAQKYGVDAGKLELAKSRLAELAQRKESGAAGPEAEKYRYEVATGAQKGATEQQFRAGVAAARKLAGMEIRSFATGREGSARAALKAGGLESWMDDKPADNPGKEKDLGGTDSGIKFSVDPKAEAKFNEGGFGPGDSTGKPSSSGKRMVTVTAADGRTAQQELSEDEINELRSDKRVKSVQ